VRFFYIKEYVWAWWCAAITVFLLYHFIKDFFKPKPNYWSYYYIILMSLWLCWREYSDYKRDLRLEKYGMIYNKTRQQLGIPIIPVGWHTESPGSRSVTWRGKVGIEGHEEKYISLDSSHKINYERDEYNFKGVNDTSRSISILFDYAKGKSKDSIVYWYHLKDTTLTISRHQADSILNAAKIRKDY
jgi:hypothetical protein